MAGDPASVGKDARYARYQRDASSKFAGFSSARSASWYSAW